MRMQAGILVPVGINTLRSIHRSLLIVRFRLHPKGRVIRMEDYREQFEKVFERLPIEGFLEDPSAIIPLMLDSGFDPCDVRVLSEVISRDAERFEDAISNSEDPVDGIVSEMADCCGVSEGILVPLVRGIRSFVIVPGTDIVVARGAGRCRMSADAWYSLDMKTLLMASKDAEHFSIPSTVTTIDDCAFECCFRLKKVRIPDSVTSIGESAFSECGSLKEIRIPGSVVSIGCSAFYKCRSLEKAYMPDSVTYVGESAFQHCDSLTEVRMSDSVASIEADTFSFCESLKKINMPESLTDIGGGAFSWCVSLKKVRIPASVKAIGDRAFLGCQSARFVVDPDNGSYSSRKGALFNKDGSVLVIGYPLVRDGVCDIPDSVTTIGSNALSCCRFLKKVRMPDSVTTIGDGALSSCKSLKKVRMSASVTEIGEGALSYCSSLEDLRIPDSVKTIGKDAFSGCESIKEIRIPDSVEEPQCISFSWCKSLEKVDLPDNLTAIADCAFEECGSLKEIFIPDSVTDIGHHAFIRCRSLKKVCLPDSLRTIGGFAFSGCDSLKDVRIPDSVTEIGPSAFCDCCSLKNVRIPASVTEIGGLAFIWCLSARFDVDSGNGCYSSRGGALFNKDGSVLISGYRLIRGGVCDIPDSVEVIGRYALSWCESLKEVRIPASVTRIDKNAFEGCESARYIVDPDNGSYKSVDGTLMKMDGTPYFQEDDEWRPRSIGCSQRFDPRFSRGYRSAIPLRT